MTEAEAKTKWCPMVRHVGPRTPLDTTPADAVHNDGAHCVGPKCMMWRWDGWPGCAKVENQQGHCGLAGNDKTATSIW